MMWSLILKNMGLNNEISWSYFSVHLRGGHFPGRRRSTDLNKNKSGVGALPIQKVSSGNGTASNCID